MKDNLGQLLVIASLFEVVNENPLSEEIDPPQPKRKRGKPVQCPNCDITHYNTKHLYCNKECFENRRKS